MSTDTSVDITVTFTNGVINSLLIKETEYGCNALEKLLKLYTTKTTTNMHMFDESERLKKFENINDIIAHYVGVRHGVYVKRKAYQMDALKNNVKTLTNKAKFITEILEETLDLRRKKGQEIIDTLNEKGYDMLDNDNFKYLVRLPMDSVSEENVEKLLRDKGNKVKELATLEATTETETWLGELAELRTSYIEYKNKRLESMNEGYCTDTAKGKEPAKKKKKKLIVKS